MVLVMDKNNCKIVCHVIHSFDHIGGAENVIVNLLNNQNDDCKHIVCSLTSIGQIKNRVNNKKVTYHALNKPEGNDPFLPYRLYKVFKEEKVSVVHLRGWACLLEGYIAAKIAGVPRVIYSEHGRHFEDVWENKKINISVKRYLFKRVDRLMTVSSQLCDEIKELYSIQRYIHVVRNGVNTDKFKPENKHLLRKHYGFDDDAKIVGIVGRLVPGKGIEEFLTTLPRDAMQHQVVIVGDGPLIADIKRILHELGLDNCVSLLGSRNDVADLMKVFDLLCMPSQSEGLSNVILEAMSTALPVVAFSVGGNTELIDPGKGGFLSPLNDWAQFHTAIDTLLRDRHLLDEFGAYNRSKILESFSLISMFKRYDELYFSNEQSVNRGEVIG